MLHDLGACGCLESGDAGEHGQQPVLVDNPGPVLEARDRALDEVCIVEESGQHTLERSEFVRHEDGNPALTTGVHGSRAPTLVVDPDLMRRGDLASGAVHHAQGEGGHDSPALRDEGAEGTRRTALAREVAPGPSGVDADRGSVVDHAPDTAPSAVACQTKIDAVVKAQVRTTIPAAALAAMARAELARRSFAEFFKQAWPVAFPSTPLAWGKHIELLCNTIQAQLEDRQRARLDLDFVMRAQNVLMNVPPRSLKTTILTFATVWAWLAEPTMRILYISANPKVLLDSARWAQILIVSPWFAGVMAQQPEERRFTLDPSHSALTDFGNTLGGTRTSRGADSNITGTGADWIIVDDPHDVRDSEANIATTVEGYDAAIHNRINDPRTSIRTAIMQRFRVDDFSGHVLENHGKGEWLHVRLPATFETEPMCACGTCVGVNVYGFRDWRTVEGEKLHPRFSDAFLASELRIKGPYGYDGQLQQNPAPPTGGMLKNQWWGWFKLPEDPDVAAWKRPRGCSDRPAVILPRRDKGRGRLDIDTLVVSVDGTFGNTKESEGSAVGLGVWAMRGACKYQLDDQTEAIGYLESIERITGLIETWAHECPDVRVLVEPKAFGPMAVEELRRQIQAGTLKDRNGKRVIVTVEVLRGADVDGEGRKGVAGDKITRAYAAVPTLHAGLVFLREGASYVGPYVAETGAFPKGKRDDRVDQTTQLINHYADATDLESARAQLLR